MRGAWDQGLGVSKQRGFWLRCFLSAALLAMILNGVRKTSAQIDPPRPYHLSHLRGVFVDAKGNPIEGAAVTLDQDDQVKYSTRTDRTGRFEIKHVYGHYWLHVDSKGYSTLGREVLVGLDGLSYLHTSTLYMIAGPGACTDDCSSVFTSRSKFDQALRRNTGHYD
jgi:hypothetical protein